MAAGDRFFYTSGAAASSGTVRDAPGAQLLEITAANATANGAYLQLFERAAPIDGDVPLQSFNLEPAATLIYQPVEPGLQYAGGLAWAISSTVDVLTLDAGTTAVVSVSGLELGAQHAPIEVVGYAHAPGYSLPSPIPGGEDGDTGLLVFTWFAGMGDNPTPPDGWTWVGQWSNSAPGEEVAVALYTSRIYGSPAPVNCTVPTPGPTVAQVLRMSRVALAPVIATAIPPYDGPPPFSFPAGLPTDVGGILLLVGASRSIPPQSVVAEPLTWSQSGPFLGTTIWTAPTDGAASPEVSCASAVGAQVALLGSVRRVP